MDGDGYTVELRENTNLDTICCQQPTHERTDLLNLVIGNQKQCVPGVNHDSKALFDLYGLSLIFLLLEFQSKGGENPPNRSLTPPTPRGQREPLGGHPDMLKNLVGSYAQSAERNRQC